MRRPRQIHGHAVDRIGSPLGQHRGGKRLGFAARYRLDPQLLDDQHILADKAETLAMCLGKGRAHRLGAVPGDADRLIVAGIAKLRQHRDPDRRRIDALLCKARGGGGGKLGQRPLQRAVAQRQAHGRLAHHAAIGQPDADRRQHARQRMNQHLRHAQRIGDKAGMLTARSAETGQGIGGGVLTPRDRDGADRPRHTGDRDRHQPLGRRHGVEAFARRGLHLIEQLGERALGGIRIGRQVPIGAEQRRKMDRLDLAQDHVAIGDGQRPAAPVAGRPRVRPRRGGADQQPPAIEMTDRPAPRRDRVDAHHRHRDAHARQDRIGAAVILPGEQRHVGRGAAHVEADHPVEACASCRARHADDAARRAGQQRVLAMETVARDQPAARLHEQQSARRRLAQTGFQPLYIAAQHRRQIGVGQRRIAARDQSDQRRGAVADRNLGEARRLGQFGQRQLMCLMLPAVHQDDGDRPKPA